jgi:hypothetical protein
VADVFEMGDAIILKADGREVEATVVLVSGNGRSLMLSFDAVIHDAIGMMPVLRQDDDSWREVIGGHTVVLERPKQTTRE